MIISLVAVLVLCLFGIKLHGKLNEYYLGKEQTGAIKGLFAVVIFLSHVIQYFPLHGGMSDKLFDFGMGVMGQNIVVAFLLYSGYGVGCAYLSKGKNYLKSLPKKRILSIWIHFLLALILFWIVDLALIRGGYAPADYVLSMFAWVSVGNSTWFVFAILLCWILTCVCFRLFNNKHHALICLTVLLCGYVVTIAEIKHDHAWYDTVLCYPLGMLIAFQKERVDRFFRSGWRTVLATGVLGIAWLTLRLVIDKNIVLYEVQSVLFALFLLSVTSRIEFGNKALAWLGRHSFSIYILQRVPMLILAHFGVPAWNRWGFILASALATGLIAWIFDTWIMKPINRALQKEKVIE